MASPVLSKDLCVQIDEGVYGGSLVVLERVKLGPQQHGPVHGFLRRFSGAAGFTDDHVASHVVPCKDVSPSLP